MTTFDTWVKHLPHCLELLSDGCYALLNRRREQLPCDRYCQRPIVVALNVTPETASKLSFNGEDDVRLIVLYKDAGTLATSEAARREYQRRLEMVADIELPGSQLRLGEVLQELLSKASDYSTPGGYGWPRHVNNVLKDEGLLDLDSGQLEVDFEDDVEP